MSLRAYIASLWMHRGAYRACFLSADGKPTNEGSVVLSDLRRFCYGARPTLKGGDGRLDPYASVAAAARQEVYFRIVDKLHLDDSDIRALEQRAHKEEANG